MRSLHRHTRAAASIAAAIVFVTAGVFSQQPYRSHQSGSWNTLSAWEVWNGSQWTYPAPHRPSWTDATIQIQAGHVITVPFSSDTSWAVDELTVEEGGAVQILTGAFLRIHDGVAYDMSVLGTLVNQGRVLVPALAAIRFAGNGLYRHAQNDGFIPLAAWEGGSTCEITGVTANAPASGNQNFYNFTWDCPGQSTNLGLSWNNNTVNGNIRILNTNGLQLRMTAPPIGGSANVTINGDIMQSGGHFTSTGTSNDATTVTIHHYGNVFVTGGNFSVCRGSQGGPTGTGTTTWYWYGETFSLRNATTQNSNPRGAMFVFAREGRQVLDLSGVTFLGGLPIQVNPGTTLAMGTSVLGDAGLFTLLPAGTLECGHINGINGNIATTGTKTFSPSATYVFNGQEAQVTGSLLPASVRQLVIDNPSGVTLTANTDVRGRFTLTAGNLITGPNVLTVPDTAVVIRTTGHVIGNLRKDVSEWFPWRMFEIGDGSAYTPVLLEFHDLIQSGFVTATTIGSDHPQILSSGIDPFKSLNRFYSVLNSGVVFDNYTATFNFVGGDLDPSTDPEGFICELYDGTTWLPQAVGVRTATSTQITGGTAFGDFAFGESENTPPLFTNLPASVDVNEELLFAFDVNATDPEAPPQTLTFSLVDPPLVGASINELTGEFTWTPTEEQGPRSYEFVVRVTDGMVATTATLAINLLEVNKPPVLGEITAPLDPMQLDITFSASAPFHDYDIPIGTHTAVWVWGDNTTSDGAVTYTEPTGGTVTGEHAYEAAGVYSITLTLRDNYGAEAQTIYSYIVVFDPEGGFVTGGGWITSPPNAYAVDPELTGKATFGFVAKYQRGSTVPTGNTEFQFRVAELNFKSTSYQWLVIAGPKAKYKGSGTINGRGDYSFLLTAIDGQMTGGDGVDKFRIKIWDLNNGGQLVYDNKLGEDDASDAATELGGGSIVIHRPGRDPLARVGAGDIPTEFALYQNSPNPFNPTTTVTFDVPTPSVVTMTVYDCMGRQVASMVEGREMEAGRHMMSFDGAGYASGIYFCRITADVIPGNEQEGVAKKFTEMRKMLLLK